MSISLTAELAKQFDMPLNTKGEHISQIEITDIVDTESEITISFSDELDKSKKYTKQYSTASLSGEEMLFIAWARCEEPFSFTIRPDFKAIAKILLSKSGLRDSCVASYVEHSYGLYGNDPEEDVRELYRIKGLSESNSDQTAIFCPFPDYYRLIWRKDKNQVRAIAAIREGHLKFPTNPAISRILAAHLIDSGHLNEALEVLKNVDYLSTDVPWHLIYEIYCLGLKAHIGLKQYENAMELTERSLNSRAEKNFFTGLIHYEAADVDMAADFFYKSIECTFDDDDFMIASTFYLIRCLLDLGNIPKATEALGLLPKKKFDLSLSYFDFSFSNFAEETLRLFLRQDVDEITEGDVSALLAYIILAYHLPDDDTHRKLTKPEIAYLNDAKELAQKALIFHPSVPFYNYIYSELLYRDNNFDEAQKYSLLGDNDESHECSVTLRKCSASFIKKYPDLLKMLDSSGLLSPSDYWDTHAYGDIRALFKIQEYMIISHIIDWLDSENIIFLDPKNEVGLTTRERNLFEIAYSYKESGNLYKAKYFYELMPESGEESSSSLNNLALIYEDLGDTENAKLLIIKAQKLLGHSKDDIVARNYARIVGHEEANHQETTAFQEKKVGFAFDGVSGNLTVNGIRIPIPQAGLQFHVCNFLFTQGASPFEWVTEQVMEDSYSYGEDIKSKRWLKDAVYNINKKIKIATQLEKTFEYVGARVRVNPIYSN